VESPSTTVESLCRTVEGGDIDKAEGYFSAGLISKRGASGLRTDITNVALELKEHGGIKSIKVIKENIVGNVAEVLIEVTRGNGFVATANYKLIKENGEWKVDEVTGGPGSQNIEPAKIEGTSFTPS
jgi:hypothetical protein